jgi:ATP-dependent Clp protease adaptor protein ClpS
MSDYNSETYDDVSSDVLDEVREPFMYRVLLHNDDYTSMDFVVEILQYVFNKSVEESTMIMLKVHNEGIGLCGVYTYEIAETKVNMVHALAKEREFPLKCTMEKD